MARSRKRNESNWISFSDVMTGLMVIFMFVAISYIVEVKKQQAERDQLFENFKATKEDLFAELDSTFHSDFEAWKVELDRDLSIKFTNPDILFSSGEAVLPPYFVQILDKFLPRYFDIVLKEKYRGKISEIRIEGHTDTVPDRDRDADPYLANIRLSQERSAEVLKFFRNSSYYDQLSSAEELQLQYWLTANGLSYGRTLDSNKKPTLFSGNPVDKKLSRRVEFRIVTTSDSLVQRVIDDLSN